MSELSRLSSLLHNVFASDQNSHIRQQPDGTYLKVNKPLSLMVVKTNIEEEGAIGVYQKNIDSTVCWICFDFDVRKKYIGSTVFDAAMKTLSHMVDDFCEGLVLLEIPYLLEYSGNRGMHIWIFFQERIEYRIAYEIAETIKGKLLGDFDDEFIALDMFPKSRISSAGVGFGVKIPVSKHAKSGRYSLMLENQTNSSSVVYLTELSHDVLKGQANILERVARVTKAELEKKLGGFFEVSRDYTFNPHRIKKIKVDDEVDGEKLLLHWGAVSPLIKLKEKICGEHKLSHSERMLLVGVLINIESDANPDLGFDLLINIFGRTDNFNLEVTKKAIDSLRSYHFPSQLQIETVMNCKFGEALPLDGLLNACAPAFISFEDGSFELSFEDIGVARGAELKYVFQNDEVYCHKVINELAALDSQKFIKRVEALNEEKEVVVSYSHERHEQNKSRKLVTLGSVERVFTSAVLNQLDYFYKFKPSINSFGYQLNSGFKDGYIFKPWLYLWMEFVSNIASALEDPANKEFYVVKVDISSYYDTISHEQLKRLLLGGVNKKLDEKLEQLTSIESDKYKILVDKLLRFTSNFSKNGVGLPQGPAYARYMAELYLDNIDTVFEGLLSSGGLLFYHRYVDDIFFISKTKAGADEYLALLKGLIENLGLRINDSKTKSSKISNFGMDFQQYRTQSKYAVDRASRSASDLSNTQKNLAINEFMALVKAETCEDDLAFIFSHLNDISELDEVKYEMVRPALASGKGRGSLFKHIFCFVFDDCQRWDSLLEIDSFGILQSEVLTSTMLSHLANLPVGNPTVLSFFEKLLLKISESPLVQEHLVFLKVLYGVNVNLASIPSSVVATAIRSFSEPAKLYVDASLVRHLSTMLAAEKNLDQFVELIFPLCISFSIPAPELNKLAEIFYAKLANDYRTGSLNLDLQSEFFSQVLAVKYYYLLCIFSLSDSSSDLPLLKAMWEMCIGIFNKLDSPMKSVRSDNWFAKLSHISIHHPKSTIVMAAILDGSICRGIPDNNAIFEYYHNMVMIFISSRMDEIVPIYGIAEKLEALKKQGIFYKWLLDNDGASHFPSQTWFEHNAFENNCIMLRRGGEVLIRKAVSDFAQDSSSGRQKAYAEKVEMYSAGTHRSIRDALSGLSFLEFIEAVVTILTRSKDTGCFPNFFSDARIVTATGFEPFTKELSNLPSLIFERSEGVAVYKGEMDNFINCIFSVEISGGLRQLVEDFASKYLSVVGLEITKYKFLKSFRTQLEQLPNPGSKMSIDIAAAAAVYLELRDFESLRRVEKFFEYYSKFDVDVRCIFCVESDDVISDANPSSMLLSLIRSFDKISLEISTALAFNISHDLRWLLGRLESTLDDNSTLGFTLVLNEFSKSRVDVRATERVLGAGQDEYPFEGVYVVHAVAGVVQNFDFLKHSFLVQNSSHVYVAKRGGKLIVMPINIAVGKMYNILSVQYKKLIESGASSNYPKGTMIIDALEYKNCDQAARVISEHRDISVAEAENILGKWLNGIPEKFRQAACSLIAGHVVMRSVELDRFVSQVEEVLSDPGKGAFFIKELTDFNGTQRVLLRRQQLIRYVGAHGPLSIPLDSDEATVVVDNVITGVQIISALKYYVLNTGRSQNYYRYSVKQLKELSAKLKTLKRLSVVQVLHTEQGIDAIRKFCVENLNPNIVVEAVGGRNIGGDAFFGSTKALSHNEKLLIREVLSTEDSIGELYNNLSGVFDPSLLKGLDNINMVARFRSLPKRCFSFLHLGSIFDPRCAPFERVKENYERSKDTNS